MANNPPPMPSTPAVKPMVPPASRLPTATTSELTVASRRSSACLLKMLDGGIQTRDMPDSEAGYVLSGRVGTRDECGVKPQFGGLSQAFLTTRRRTDFSGQTDLPKHDPPRGQRTVAQ